MKVKFRNFVPADIFTVRNHMPFSQSENTVGMVAYDLETARTVGMIIAQEFTKTSCMVHILILNPMLLRPKYRFIWSAGEWLFGKAKLKKLFALVIDTNWKSRNLCEKIGFKEKAVLEDAVDEGVDFILLELKRDECNFWQEREMEKVA